MHSSPRSALRTGLVGPAGSRAAGSGWFAGVGLTVAFLGIRAFAVISLLTYADRGAGDRFSGVAISGTAVGMLLTGVAVLRARRWQG